MDQRPDSIANFEEILKQHTSKKPTRLYSTSEDRNSTDFSSKINYNPKDIIKNISAQIKAIQNADCFSKSANKMLEEHKTSSFVPVNKLQTTVVQHTKAAKFETQFVLDTQLINVIEDVEAMSAHKGITQEFESTFDQTNLNRLKPPDEKAGNCLRDTKSSGSVSVLKNPDKSVNIIEDSKTKSKSNKDSIEFQPILDISQEKVPKNDGKYDLAMDNHCTALLDRCMEIEENVNIQSLITDTEINPSPIMNINRLNKSNSTSPLVYNLDSFEQFEKIALPIIEENNDMDTVKHLINSQIIGKELFIETNFEPELSTRKENLSPVLKITKTPKINTHKESLEQSSTSYISMNNLKDIQDKVTESTKTEETMLESPANDKLNLIGNTLDNFTDVVLKDSTNKQEKKSISYEDEILFSSDEENDIKETNVQDLPFTCALETSFYEHSDVLDTTMYVGFQTASNKSIQVSTVSFTKAKSILDDEIDGKVKVPTLKELVEKCDTPKSKITFISGNTKNKVDTNEINQSRSKELDVEFKIASTNITEFVQAIEVADKNMDNSKSLFCDVDNTATLNKKQSQVLEIKNFDGFKTASNKNINLSEKALQRCKRVFQDIDLDDDFCNASLPCENEPCTKKVRHSLEHDKITIDDTIKTADKEICHPDTPKIDEDILQEFEGEMSFSDNKDDGVDQLIGFKTASNKNIAISDNALKEYQKIFGDIDFAKTSYTEIKHDYDTLNKNPNLNTHVMNIGFKTASNKIINISDKALARTKTIFQDIDLCDSENTSSCARISQNAAISKQNIKNDTINGNINPVLADKNFIGFKTASNKTIKVSEDAISKSKNLFRDIECDVVENIDDKVVDEMIRTAQNIDFNRQSTSKENFVGFRTANHKNIAISAAAYEKTKNIFQDLDKVQVESNNDLSDELDVVKLIQDRKFTEEFDKDFWKNSDLNEPNNNDKLVTNIKEDPKSYNNQTAGNKLVKISKESFVKSQIFTRDILNEKAEPEETDFTGFHTASNKRIRISDTALAKSKQIFDDLDKVKDKNIFPGHPSCSKVNISADELAKSKNIFENLDKDSKEIQLSPLFKGFQTASNKEVKISAAALAKSKKIFDDFNTEHKELCEVEKDDKTRDFKGFQTENNKDVKISAAVLAKSKKIFEDLNKDNKQIEELEQNNTNPVSKGFKTASNKKVSISDKALAKSRKISDDLNIDNKEYDILESNKTVFKGFQTASNKEVKISAFALAKSKKIFEDLDTEDSIHVPKITTSKSDLLNLNKEDKDASSFKGFQTASNKKVNISAAALAKSKKILEDIDVVKENDVQVDKNSTKPFSGFQTANNKEVKVSKEALAKSKKLFEEVERDNRSEANIEPLLPETNKSDRSSFPFRGFNTASNKEVKLSADALSKSRKMFQDLKEGKENEETNVFKGFQSGSNKKVVISEEALAKSRQILSDIKVNEHPKPSFGFKTANNNKIQVSEEALIKSRQLFTEIVPTEEDVIPNSCVIKLKTDLHSKTKPEINIDKLIDTQVIKNFDESLNTEDFRSPVNRSKRSGSPILSCPRAKKMKFVTPYKKGNVQDIKTVPTKQTEIYEDSYKKHKKYTLQDIAKLEHIDSNLETKPDFDVNAINLDNFEFTEKRNDKSNSKISLQELKVIFLESVNKKLVPDGWYENHIKLILWKLLSYEKKFPKMMAEICTAKNVLLQLKYRYHKELYSAERPTLRKILERDDVASKMLVLCVMEIYNDVGGNSATNPPELLLTDGWYSIRTCIDKMLAKYINNGKIRVGTKLATHGAELVNCEQGIAPWEDTSSVRLKIFGNSTRRARWDARLGYHAGSRMTSHLSSLQPEGGKVSSLRVLVTRVYPPLYVEKFEDGSTVTRSERLEHIHQIKYEADRQALMEKIYEEVEKELSDEESPDTEDVVINKRPLDCGSQIARLMKRSKEPSQFRANLTESQRCLLEAYTASKRDKILRDIQDRIRSKLTVVARNVVPLLKIRVAEVYNGKIHKALLSIWKPNDALAELITEGAYIEILNVVPTAIRYSELQLSAGRQTIFKQIKKLPENLQPHLKSLNRTCYPIKEIVSHPNMVTDYNEIDTIGMVIQIDPSYTDFKNINQFQNVYITDEEKNIICVNFWGGIKKFGFENVLDTGQIVACVNLQKRAGNTRKSIPQYRATEFTYFTKTPKSMVARKLVDELSKKVVKNKGFIEECLVVKNNLLKSNIGNEISPYRFHNHDLSKNKIYIESPLARIQPKIQDEFNLSGLDFESTFRQTEPQELSPKSRLRKKRIHEKISKLKMYGEPPPLSPINIINKSKNATKSFKSPLLNSSVASKCDTPVANFKKLPENLGENELNCSPVFGVNRTLKKGVNPVKLDFNKVAMEENDSVDHFAEEFDASPPLSLD